MCFWSSCVCVALLSLILLLSFTTSSEIVGFGHDNVLSSSSSSSIAAEKTVYPAPMMPEIGEMAVKMMMSDSSTSKESWRRRLGSFQVCALCTCCGGGGSGGVGEYCLPSPCCYAINCNLPNKPFGFCSFTPKACNCLGCHL